MNILLSAALIVLLTLYILVCIAIYLAIAIFYRLKGKKDVI